MATPKTEEIKVRVPTSLKEGIVDIANSRMTSESEIVREALIQYLQSRLHPSLTVETLQSMEPGKLLAGAKPAVIGGHRQTSQLNEDVHRGKIPPAKRSTYTNRHK